MEFNRLTLYSDQKSRLTDRNECFIEKIMKLTSLSLFFANLFLDTTMIGRRLGVILWWSCAFFSTLFSQDLNPKFRTYTSVDGLSQSVVNTIFQDSKNFLWFGTQDGLNRFDGFNFKVYRYNPYKKNCISDNWIARISLEDSDGDLWIVTGGGQVNVFSPRFDNFKVIPVEPDSSKRFLAFSQLFFIYQDLQKQFWISTNRGLFKFDKRTWTIQQIFVANIKEPEYVRQIMEDKNTLWFGCSDGIRRWDFKQNKLEKFNLENPALNPVKLNIFSIKKDSAGTIWFISPTDIYYYSAAKNRLGNYTYGEPPKTPENPAKKAKLKWISLPVQLIDRDILLIGSMDGLVLFNTSARTIKKYQNAANNPKSISNNIILSIFQDRSGAAWIGTNNGLNRFEIKTGEFTRSYVYPGSMAGNQVFRILEDPNGVIWTLNQEVAEGFLLGYLDKKSGIIRQLHSDPCNSSSLPLDGVYLTFTDNQNNIWYSSYGAGIVKYLAGKKKFEHFFHQAGNVNSITANSVWGMCEDRNNQIWISYQTSGLDCMEPRTGKITNYTSLLENYLHTKSPNVISVVCDKQNNLWIATLGNGIIKWNLNTRKMEHYTTASPKLTLADNRVHHLVYTKGKLMIIYFNFGADILDPETGNIAKYRFNPGDPASLLNNAVQSGEIDSNGNVWLSVNDAIEFINTKTKQIKHYKTIKNGGNGIGATIASSIFEDSKGTIWVGTHGGGLAMYDKNMDKFRFWMEEDGLVNNVVYSILEDENHFLWLSTNNGMSKFDPSNYTFTNYYADDGLQGAEFNGNSYLKTRDGKIFFGGLNGITAFYPRDITKNTATTQTIITGFQVFNKEVKVLPYQMDTTSKNPGKKVIYINNTPYTSQNISYMDKLVLTSKEKIITFEFTAMNFDKPERCKFMYIMENFDKEWNLSDKRRYATYTNLPPGEYIFKVTSANNDGVWNPEPAKILVIVKPPFYKSWWFISGFSVLTVLLIILFIRHRERKLKLDKQILENKIVERTKQLKDINEELVLRNIQILKQKEEIAMQAKQLRFELASQNQTSELALLRTQVNPHFLFNTLNNIYSLVYQKSPTAPDAVVKLSDIMRYMLYDAVSEKVLLEKEINYLKSFIELQLLRIKNKDFISFEVTGDVNGKLIAPMLLIPFIENAFKHGDKSATNPGITIKLECNQKGIIFEVQNRKNISAMKDESGGIGLNNVKRRLDLIYPQRYDLEIIEIDERFSVKLEIKD